MEEDTEEPGEPGQQVFPSLLRAVHMGGNWGTNREVWTRWVDGGKAGPLIPPDYLSWLHSIHVDWVGISVALHYDDSMDSTVERVYLLADIIPTFTDEILRQIIRELRSGGIEVYLTLAFEAHAATTASRPVERWQLGLPRPPEGAAPEDWPWSPAHPDHQRFVAEFWQTYTEQAVHFGKLAEEEGVKMYSLGTETDRLFRTRTGVHWPNDFGDELKAMVAGVRAVYDGLLTYDMHYSVLQYAEYFDGSTYLWEDLALDVVGISAYFELVDELPDGVVSTEILEQSYEDIFARMLVPLARRNPTLPILFAEYGAVDVVSSPFDSGAESQGRPVVFVDRNGNDLDDGQETQANMFQALFNVMDRHPGVLLGVFLWDNWMASDDLWAENYGSMRSFSIRDKLAEEVVREAYRP